jgi:CDP-6-deoxy-D-xylo-4-hexulose-3-dehydrase
MFDSMNETQAREKLLTYVAEYCDIFHKPKQYKPGDKINYSGRVYNSDEMVNLVGSALDFWLTSGRYTEAFEAEIAKYIGVKYCSFVNSGSSANLLAFMSLTSPLLKDRAVKPGDEVITVAAGFPTTISPIVQYGAVPVFVDVTVPQYNIDVSMLESALSDRTKAVMLAHSLGNPFDIGAVKAFCDKNGLWLIEDNCDSLGSEYTLDGVTKKTGSFGDIGTSSFYPPHHITTGEGGAVYTANPLLHKIIRSMRDWGRECECSPGQDNLCGHRFDKQFGELPKGYDHKYIYSHFGYNLKATEMQAAIGLAQIKKADAFTAARRKNFSYLYKKLEALSDKFILPEVCPNSNPSWFGFMLACKNGVNREEVVNHLEKHNIQTRTLFAGNILRQPCFTQMKKEQTGFKVIGNLDNTDYIMRDAFWIGVYPGMTVEMLDYMIETLNYVNIPAYKT